jgi:hypothetical protein
MKFEELSDLQVNSFDLSNAYAPEVWIKHTGKKIKKDRKLKLSVEIKQVLTEYLGNRALLSSCFLLLPGFFDGL